MSEYMIFCLGELSYKTYGEGFQKSYRVFNKNVSKEEYEKVSNSLSGINILMTAWVKKENMTSDEKDSVSGWDQMGGCLKSFTYQDAWKNWWSSAAQELKDKILNIPQFDAKIFKGITGIDILVSIPDLKGKTVEVKIDGREYKAIIQ